MKYLIVKFRIETVQELEQKTDIMQISRDLLADMAGEAGCESFEETPEGLNAYVQVPLFEAAVLDALLQEFPVEGVRICYTVQDVEDKDWNATWEDMGFEPIAVAGFVVYDAKKSLSVDYMAEGLMPIAIEARQAFGTGTHETTRMMIAALKECSPQGKNVLDCGCGTGILSIAASKLGASCCVGYDIDEWSVENTCHNAKLNQVDNLRTLLGDASVVAAMTDDVFDIVMANINRNILLTDMAVWVKNIASGGYLVISGFYQQDCALLCEKAATLNLELSAEYTDNNWACMVFVKR